MWWTAGQVKEKTTIRAKGWFWHLFWMQETIGMALLSFQLTRVWHWALSVQLKSQHFVQEPGFKEHLVLYIPQAEMKCQLFAHILSGVSEEGWGRGRKIITPRFSGSQKRIRKLQSPCQPHFPIAGNHPSLFILQSAGSVFLPPENERSGVQNCHWGLSLLCHDIFWHLVSWLLSLSVHFAKWIN